MYRRAEEAEDLGQGGRRGPLIAIILAINNDSYSMY